MVKFKAYSVLKLGAFLLIGVWAFYLAVLVLLITIPDFQAHAFYLHRVTLTWFKDIRIPEQFGFLPHQVTPFYVSTEDGESLHAWHILPLTLYAEHEAELLSESSYSNNDVTSTISFKLLRGDPAARLVIYFHGTAGCIASGWRPDSYRILSAAAPYKIHILSFDYRGYGLSTGTPSEKGLLLDAIAVSKWAIEVAGIPPSQIVIYGQSLGTAVALSLSQHLASISPEIAFAGLVLTASFSDVATLTATYRIGGVIPVLSPIAQFPTLFEFFNSFLTSTWSSKDRLTAFIRRREDPVHGGPYHITFLHAEDDADIACHHSNVLYWHAVNATLAKGIELEALENQKQTDRTILGNSGWSVEHKTSRGVIRQIMLKTGLHDKVMSYPIMSLAVLRAFQFSDQSFEKPP